MTFLEAAALIALSTADAQITHNNVTSHQGYERNPITRPFVTHGAALQSLSTACVLGGDMYVIRHLERSGHRKWARAVTWTSIGVEAVAVGYSWRNHHASH